MFPVSPFGLSHVAANPNPSSSPYSCETTRFCTGPIAPSTVPETVAEFHAIVPFLSPGYVRTLAVTSPRSSADPSAAVFDMSMTGSA